MLFCNYKDTPIELGDVFVHTSTGTLLKLFKLDNDSYYCYQLLGPSGDTQFGIPVDRRSMSNLIIDLLNSKFLLLLPKSYQSRFSKKILSNVT